MKRFRFFKYKSDTGTYEYMGWMTIMLESDRIGCDVDWDNMNRKQVDAIMKFVLEHSIDKNFNCPIYKMFEKKNGDIYLQRTVEFEKRCEEEYNRIMSEVNGQQN